MMKRRRRAALAGRAASQPRLMSTAMVLESGVEGASWRVFCKRGLRVIHTRDVALLWRPLEGDGMRLTGLEISAAR